MCIYAIHQLRYVEHNMVNKMPSGSTESCCGVVGQCFDKAMFHKWELLALPSNELEA